MLYEDPLPLPHFQYTCLGDPAHALSARVSGAGYDLGLTLWTPLTLPPHLETPLQPSPGQLVHLVPNQKPCFQAGRRGD